MDSKKLSILSAIAASSCCLPPLILLGLTLLGIGSAGFAGFSSTLGAMKWYLMPLAFLGLATSFYLYRREKKKCAGAGCKMVSQRFTQVSLTFSTVVVLGFSFWSLYPYISPSANNDMTISESEQFASFTVDGMTCGSCEFVIDEALKATGMIDSVHSSFLEGTSFVWYNDNAADIGHEAALDSLLLAINSVGYTATVLDPTALTGKTNNKESQ